MVTLVKPQKKSTLTWDPHTTQKIVLKAMDYYRFVTLVCGRRWGKTELMINRLIRSSWEKPGDYFYIAPLRNQAKRIAWRKLIAFFPEQMKGYKFKNESELWVQNSRGGRITLLGADDEDSLRGDKWSGCVLDEFSDMSDYVFEVVLPALGDLCGFCYFVGTPRGKNHFYEKFIKDERYQDRYYKNKENENIYPDKDFISFQFKTESNPYYPRSEIEKARKRLTADYFRQEYEASFENYTGLIYQEFSTFKKQIILPSCFREGKIIGYYTSMSKAIEFKPYYKTYVGIDTGKYTGVVFKLIDEYGNEIIFDEIYDINGLVQNISSEIKSRLEGREVTGYVIDSASQVKREYENCGIFSTDSQKDVLGSIQNTRNKMKNRKWFILSHCIHTIRELESRIWMSKKNANQKSIMPKKENDHLCNAEDYIQNTFLREIKSNEPSVDRHMDTRTVEYFTSNDYDNESIYDDLG